MSQSEKQPVDYVISDNDEVICCTQVAKSRISKDLLPLMFIDLF